MKPVIEANFKPFESVRFRQNARLVSKDQLAARQHQAISQYRLSGSGNSFCDPFSGSPDNNGLYTLQRGEFEFRVASGNLEYVPALEMTIITSYPEVEFIYTGTPNYVPPKKEPDSPALNVTI